MPPGNENFASLEGQNALRVKALEAATKLSREINDIRFWGQTMHPGVVHNKINYAIEQSFLAFIAVMEGKER